MLELLASDVVNLADYRVACPLCKGNPTVEICEVCDGTGTVEQPTDRRGLSHTQLGEFLACGHKFELRRVRRLERIDRPAPLELGKAFHAAIEYQDPARGAAIVRDGARILNQDDEDRVAIQAATVAAASRYYLARWPTNDDGHRAELRYRVRLRSPWSGAYSRTFDLVGVADGVRDAGPHLELTEIKFLGQVTEQGVRRLKLDRQITLACYGLYRATGKFVRVVNYRMVRKPSIKPRQNETVDEFIERLQTDYANPERRDFYGHQEALFRDTTDLVRIEAELWTWAEQLRHAGRQQLYPRNTSACLEHGGCEFLPLCAGDPDAPALYRERFDRQALIDHNTAASEAA